MTGYIFDNTAERETEQRFSSLESLYDPLTTRHLVATGIEPGWRCWEIGGGGGSIGLWLSDRIGPEGHVLMTDIDPRFLAEKGRSNLEVRRHDVGLDPQPDTAFDLIHARLVLIHVRSSLSEEHGQHAEPDQRGEPVDGHRRRRGRSSVKSGGERTYS
jgi:hypothetical protein